MLLYNHNDKISHPCQHQNGDLAYAPTPAGHTIGRCSFSYCLTAVKKGKGEGSNPT